MYYAIIILSVIMFGGCFALKDVYRAKRGSGIKISLQFSLTSSIAALFAMAIISGLKFEFTTFTLIMAVLSSLNGFAFTFFSFKALAVTNLSVYSLFSMLGGMVLPFAQGILFYDEDLTLAKSVCFLFIFVALILTVERGEKKRGALYYAGIFILNGMSGVISKIYTSAPFEKASAAGYSTLGALSSVIIAALLLIILGKKMGETPKSTPFTIGISAVSGITNKIANFLLVVALAHVDASVQYPMVTGGVMIISTAVCYLSKKKPSKKEILSVVFAFIGLLLLFIIPI